MTYYLSTILYCAVPVGALVFFIVSLCLYISAKRQEKRLPGSVGAGKLSLRKALLIGSSAIVGVLLAVIIGFFLLLMYAVANM